MDHIQVYDLLVKEHMYGPAKDNFQALLDLLMEKFELGQALIRLQLPQVCAVEEVWCDSTTRQRLGVK